jgi:CheY-like chemotaxis protein
MPASSDHRHGSLAPFDHPRRTAGRVLVVDDEEGIRVAVSRQLSFAGFDVVTAAGGAEALSTLRTDSSIRVVLLDMLMPDVDGWAFRREQLLDPRMAAVPAVVMTGAPLPSLVHDQLKASDYLVKPVGRDHLVSVVANYCAPAAGGAEAARGAGD